MGLVITGGLVLGACSPKEDIKHVEAFIAESYKEVPGPAYGVFFEHDGFIKVNSVYEAKDWGSKSKGEGWKIEDYYNLDGNYIKTLVNKIDSSQSAIHHSFDSEKIEEELTEPSTILVDDDFDVPFTTVELTPEEKGEVEKHVKSMVEKMMDNRKSKK